MKCPRSALPGEDFGYPVAMAVAGLLSERARELVAARFRALGEPTRLKILERLFHSPASVGEILKATGGTQANVSKHLAVLHAGRLVARAKDGNRIVYSISDPALERICSIVCATVESDAREEARAIAPARSRKNR